MARIVAAFGTSHSTMQFSKVENWQGLFDHVDRRAPINDFDGTPRSYDELLPRSDASKLSREAVAQRHEATLAAMDRLDAEIKKARLDVLVIVGDDQREIFK